MSVEERWDGVLVLKGDIVEYARKLIAKKEYFGAFARIHALLEFTMQNRYEMDRWILRGHIPHEIQFRIQHGKPKIYRYRELKNKLLKEKIISQEEANRIGNFGDIRDRIMHRLVKYSYQSRPENMVKKDEALKLFEQGVELVNALRQSRFEFKKHRL